MQQIDSFTWQVVDAREAGAASVLGIVESVTGGGSAVLSSFASVLGLEAPVEVSLSCLKSLCQHRLKADRCVTLDASRFSSCILQGVLISVSVL